MSDEEVVEATGTPETDVATEEVVETPAEEVAAEETTD